MSFVKRSDDPAVLKEAEYLLQMAEPLAEIERITALIAEFRGDHQTKRDAEQRRELLDLLVEWAGLVKGRAQ